MVYSLTLYGVLLTIPVLFSNGFPTMRQVITDYTPPVFPCAITSGTARGRSHGVLRLLANVQLYTREVVARAISLRDVLLQTRFTEADERTKEEVLASHWPYVHKLNPNSTSVSQALEMPYNFTWTVLREELMVYSMFINYLKIDEQIRATRPSLSTQQAHSVTFEEEARQLHDIYVARLLCAFNQLHARLMRQTSLTPRGHTRISSVIYYSEDTKRQTDIRSLIILNSFVTDYLTFVQRFVELYSQTIE